MDPEGAGAPRAPDFAPVRWGVGDAALVWVVALIGAALTQAPFVDGRRIPDSQEAVATVASVAVQTALVLVILAYISRSRGRGSLATDFGLRVKARDGLWVLGGAAIALVATGLTVPILELGDLSQDSQDVVRIFERADGLEAALFAFGVLVLAPIGEEVLFRGVLLRGLQRRIPAAGAIFGAALAFGLVHVLLDPGSGYGVPSFLLLGLVAGWRAVATGDLSQSVLLHAGFNLVAVVDILT
jgi:membrane protease YdiL (CAAX protease family)